MPALSKARKLLIKQKEIGLLDAAFFTGTAKRQNRDNPPPEFETAKTLNPSFSSRNLASSAAAASTILVTTSPDGVPKRQIYSDIDFYFWDRVSGSGPETLTMITRNRRLKVAAK